MAGLVRLLGYLAFWGAGIVLFVIELGWFSTWWGGLGVLGAISLPPLAAAFPFIYLALEGFDPNYFAIWAIGLAGMFAVTLGAARG
jgi:hypothetical protein